jgi:ankyrin repeat protein
LNSLLLASLRGHADVVKLLLAAGANANAMIDDGATSLFLASEGGYGDVVKLLLAAGANVNAALKDGTTPLMVASRRHPDVAQLLRAAGAK